MLKKLLSFTLLSTLIVPCFYLKSNLLLAQTESASISTIIGSLILQGQVPKASSRTILSKDVLVKYQTLREALENFSQGLRKAGYDEQGWYEVNNQELKIFAITELEQIRENGHSRTDGKRWILDYSSPEINSLRKFIQTLLIGASPAKYRAFIFVFSTENTSLISHSVQPQIESLFLLAKAPDIKIPKTHSLEDFDEAEFFVRAIREGRRGPFFTSLGNINTTEKNYLCNVYIYEYESSPADGSIKFIKNSNIPATEHLKGAGILEALNIQD